MAPPSTSRNQGVASEKDSRQRDRSLPEEINIATRHVHTTLNRAILARLPLALPPHSIEPNVYATGLLHFAPIYATFESLWRALPEKASIVTEGPNDERVTPLLSRLYMPELVRTESLKQDLADLLQLQHGTLEEMLYFPASLQVRAFTEHIRQEVTSKPHVLIAYAWVMYMALFNGGRWIRAQLRAAGSNFWNAGTMQRTNDTKEIGNGERLRFFHFNGSHDGEDIKEEFKLRLAKAECHLTIQERQDIVAEAERIFQYCTLLVEDLDHVIAAQRLETPMSSMPLTALLIKHIFPMGMVDLVTALGKRLSLSAWHRTAFIDSESTKEGQQAASGKAR